MVFYANLERMVARPASVSLVSLPESTASSLTGINDVLSCFPLLGTFDAAVPETSPFEVRIVVPSDKPRVPGAFSFAGEYSTEEVDQTDIVIVPSVLLPNGRWQCGRYPELVDWLVAMHRGGAMLCSACSGVLLLAETGLLSGRHATIHWAYAKTFLENFPDVALRLDRVLIATGNRQEFVMSGASASWHDLVLYLVARLVGTAAAHAISKFMLLQWHVDGQAPYVVFQPVMDHGDAAILDAQAWLAKNYSIANPVEQMIKRSGLAERSFKRRFTTATGLPPIAYVQRVRIEEAKQRLERTERPIEEISWKVGYEDPAFFHRLFKRTTSLTPGAYRRKFRMPAFAEL